MATVTQIVEGLTILGKYAKTEQTDDPSIGGADHDVIWGPCVGEDEPSEDDQFRLELLGWFWSEEYACWSRFC